MSTSELHDAQDVEAVAGEELVVGKSGGKVSYWWREMSREVRP